LRRRLGSPTLNATPAGKCCPVTPPRCSLGWDSGTRASTRWATSGGHHHAVALQQLPRTGLGRPRKHSVHRRSARGLSREDAARLQEQQPARLGANAGDRRTDLQTSLLHLTVSIVRKKPGPVRSPVSVCRCGGPAISRGEHAAHRLTLGGNTRRHSAQELCEGRVAPATPKAACQPCPNAKRENVFAVKTRNANAARWQPGNREKPVCGQPL
jgi:hypothetical protein